MNSRFFFTPDSICISNSVSISSISPAAIDERAGLNPRPSRNSPPLLIRLAMKASRSKWFVFLRRVFHYQNGSGSDLGPNPFDSPSWMLMEFVALAIQISLTGYTLLISRGERPVWPMRIWVSGYALGCFLSLVLLFLRYRLASSGSDIEQQGNYDESR